MIHIPNLSPRYQPLPNLSENEFKSLKKDIEQNGLLCPIIEDEMGNILDGHQRKRALIELRIEKYPTRVLYGLNDLEKWFFALSTNLKRRHLTTAQKRKLIEDELKRHPEIANTPRNPFVEIDRIISTTSSFDAFNSKTSHLVNTASKAALFLGTTFAAKINRAVVSNELGKSLGRLLDTYVTVRGCPHKQLRRSPRCGTLLYMLSTSSKNSTSSSRCS